MSKKIELTRSRNINAERCDAGCVLELGKDVSLAHAQTLVRIGNAVWVKDKKTKDVKPVEASK